MKKITLLMIGLIGMANVQTFWQPTVQAELPLGGTAVVQIVQQPARAELPPGGAAIKYCENISDQLKRYEDSETLFADLTVKAQSKALRELLKAELQKFTPQMIDEETFIQALLHIVQYTDTQRVSDGLLTPCVVLQQTNIDAIHRKRFTPVEVGRVCSFDEKLLKKQLEKMKNEFVTGFFSKKPDKTAPQSLKDVIVEQDKITQKYGKDLSKLLREEELPADGSAVENTKCTALQVYPIEIYALSVPYRKEVVEEEPENTALSGDQRLRFIAGRQARLHGIDPDVFKALIQQESKWKAGAVSRRGAVGLAQLMPDTARGECGLTKAELRDPQENLSCAAHYLAKNLRRFKELDLALCAYNAGPGIAKQRKCRKLRETRNYVAKIMKTSSKQRDTLTPKVTLD